MVLLLSWFVSVVHFPLYHIPVYFSVYFLVVVAEMILCM